MCACTSEEVQYRTPVDDAIRAGDFLTATSAPWTCHRFYLRPGAASRGLGVTSQEERLHSSFYYVKPETHTASERARTTNERAHSFISWLLLSHAGRKNMKSCTARARRRRCCLPALAHYTLFISILLKKMPERK